MPPRNNDIDDSVLAELVAGGLSVKDAAQAIGQPYTTVIAHYKRLKGQPGPHRMSAQPSKRVLTPDAVVGIVGDTHLPFAVDGYLEFCIKTFARWNVKEVVHIGDLFDNHAISFHSRDPDGMSAGDELAAAKEAARDWYAAFPRVTWTLGNHDRLPWRQVFSSGLPARIVHGEYYDTPDGWTVVESCEIDGVLYTHGTGSGGESGAKNLARRRGVSCVIGHLHRSAGVQYLPSHDGQQRFGLSVGCGVDYDSYSQSYSRDYGRMCIGCGIVIGGKEAHYIPML